jgi:hypothetical protein
MTKKLTGRTTITTDCGILREVYDILNVAYSKFYSPSKHLATDKVTTFQREGFIHAHKHFGIKIYTLTLMATHMTMKCT